MDLDAFLRNASFLSRRAGGAALLAVLKADAYGHGAVPLARALERRPPARFWGIGVSSVEEGLVLRQAGVKKRILILGSLFPFESFSAALEHGLTPTVASWASAQAVSRAAARRHLRAAIHVKVDTGMGRIGMTPATATQVLPKIASLPAIQLEGVYTHLAQGEDSKRCQGPLSLFDRLISACGSGGLSPLFHAANSAGMLLSPKSRYDLVRPGLALYGAPPSPAFRGLFPVLTWKTRVVYLKTVPPGTAVSYGGLWRAPRRARLATLPVGYADGYRRGMTGKAEVLIQGRRRPVVGRITMDQIVVDVTGLGGVDVGTEVVLLGAQGRGRITADEMAAWAGTISYEVLCGISGRVPRIHL